MAGLPNITGKMGPFRLASNSASEVKSEGATLLNENVPSTGSGRGLAAGIGDSNPYDIYTFDASHSSSIYGNSNTVQPQSIQCYLEFYLN